MDEKQNDLRIRRSKNLNSIRISEEAKLYENEAQNFHLSKDRDTFFQKMINSETFQKKKILWKLPIEFHFKSKLNEFTEKAI